MAQEGGSGGAWGRWERAQSWRKRNAGDAQKTQQSPAWGGAWCRFARLGRCPILPAGGGSVGAAGGGSTLRGMEARRLPPRVGLGRGRAGDAYTPGENVNAVSVTRAGARDPR